MSAALLDRTRFVHDSLARGILPAQVRYFFFAGTGHETVTRANASSREEIATISYAGPPVARLRLLMPALASRGLYQITYVGQPVSSEPLKFAAVAA